MPNDVTPGQAPYRDPFPDPPAPAEDDEEEEETETASAEVLPPQPPPPPRRRRRRSDLGVPRKPVSETSQEASAFDVKLPGIEIDHRDVSIMWPITLQYLADNQRGPQDLELRIFRQGTGNFATPDTPVDFVDGSMFANDDGGTSGAQKLIDYITSAIHLGRQYKGPALYKITTRFKDAKGGATRMMTLRLDHPDEIRGMLARKQEWQDQQHAAPPPRPYARPPSMGYSPTQAPMPQYAAPPQSPPQAAPAAPPPPTPPSALAPGQDPIQVMQSYFQLYEAWRERWGAQAAAAAPPPPPPAPVAPPPQAPALSKEDQALLNRARAEEAARSLGWAPPQAQAPVQPAHVAQAVHDPISALRDYAKQMKEFEGLKDDLADFFGLKPQASAPEEPPEEEEKPDPPKFVEIPIARPFGRPVYFPQDTEGTVDFVQKAVMANLETSGELAMRVLGGLAKSIDNTSLGRVLERLAAASPQAAEVARAAKAMGMVGEGTAAPAPPRKGPTG